MSRWKIANFRKRSFPFEMAPLFKGRFMSFQGLYTVSCVLFCHLGIFFLALNPEQSSAQPPQLRGSKHPWLTGRGFNGFNRWWKGGNGRTMRSSIRIESFYIHVVHVLFQQNVWFLVLKTHLNILWGAHMYMYTYNNKYCICFVVYAAVVYRSVHRNWIKSRYRHHWWYNGSGGPHEVSSKIQFLLWLTAVY